MQQNNTENKKQEATKSQKSQSGKGFLKNQPPIAIGFSQIINHEKLGGNSDLIQENNSELIAQNDIGDIETPSNLSENNSLTEAEPVGNKRPMDDLAFLDLRQVLLYGDFTRPLKPKEAEVELKIQSPFSVGVMAAQSFQTNPKGDEKTIIGYQGGLVLQYRLKGPWHIGAGLQYKYRTGTFEASKAAIGRNYRFGLEIDTFVLRPTSLHYLSLPLHLLWQKNRHVLEGGVSFDYLLGVRGEKGQYERTVEPPIRREFQVEEKGWLVENGYKKINTAVQLGYRYRVNRQLSFGLSVNYTFGGILKKDYEQPVIGNFLLKEADKFYLDIRAVYLIK